MTASRFVLVTLNAPNLNLSFVVHKGYLFFFWTLRNLISPIGIMEKKKTAKLWYTQGRSPAPAKDVERQKIPVKIK